VWKHPLIKGKLSYTSESKVCFRRNRLAAGRNAPSSHGNERRAGRNASEAGRNEARAHRNEPRRG